MSIKTLCASRYKPPEIDCTVSKENWWSRLHASTHILNPLGNGVQSSKFFEALLMRTIPICTRHLVFQKLFDPDWPMILVDDFTVLLDEERLVIETRRAQEKMSRHHAQLSNVYGLWAYLHEGRFR